MIVTNDRGEEFELTPDEEKFLRAFKRLDKMNQGRLCIWAGGSGVSLRLGGFSSYRTVYSSNNLIGDGGDGGDDFD